MSNSRLQELDLAALRVDLPQHKLVAGDIGTVVLVHGDSEAYEVEFVRADGHTIALETLYPDQVEPVDGTQILHLREMVAV